MGEVPMKRVLGAVFAAVVGVSCWLVLTDPGSTRRETSKLARFERSTSKTALHPVISATTSVAAKTETAPRESVSPGESRETRREVAGALVLEGERVPPPYPWV